MTQSPKAREELVVFYSGKGTKVRVIREEVRGERVLRVEWYLRGMRKVKDFPDTKAGFDDARSEALTVYNAKLAGKAPTRLSIGTMWKAYQKAEFEHLGPATRKNYVHAWTFFDSFFGSRFEAEAVTHEKLDELRDELRKRRDPALSVRMVQDIFGMIRRVYRWAEGRELIGRNRPESYRYKIAKADRPDARDEFSPDERDKVLKALDPYDWKDWRAYVALTICGLQGARQHAVLHLTWSDIDFENRIVTWQAEWDKMGKTWSQPLREGTISALRVSQHWQQKIGYTGPYVVPSARRHSTRPHYTKQALAIALRKAEMRAGIDHKPGRGAHGMRRTVSHDVSAISGDPMLGLHAIGDSSAKMVTKYIRPRTDSIRDAFDALDRGQADGVPSTHRQQPKNKKESSEGPLSSNSNEDNDL